MERLIDGLLRLSRVTQAPFQRDWVDLTAVARLIADNLRETHGGRRMELAIEPGLAAFGDGQLLEAALTNLLSNAAKFTAKKAEARIEVARTEHDGQAAFYVRDNGAPASTWNTPDRCSDLFSVCTGSPSFQAQASGWPPCSASFTVTAAGFGPKRSWTVARRSTSHSGRPTDYETIRPVSMPTLKLRKAADHSVQSRRKAFERASAGTGLSRTACVSLTPPTRFIFQEPSRKISTAD